MYRLKYWMLISCLVLALGVAAQDKPKESHMQDSGRMHKKWVPFDLVLREIEIWRDDGEHEHPCQIIDWDLMHTPNPLLTVMIPPSNIHTPIRIAFRLTWKERPSYWMGINGVAEYKCRFRVRNKVVEINLEVSE